MNTPYPPQQPGNWGAQGPGQQYPPPGQYGHPAGQYGHPGQYGYPGQYGHPGQQPGGGAIALTTKYFPLAFLFALFKPKVVINGMETQGSWGRSVIPLPPGQHHLHVHVPYLLPSRVGPADAQVPVQPGQTVELEYRAPVWSFSPGSLGAPPQKYNGMPILYAMLALSVVLILCSCLIPILTNNTN